MFNAIPSMKQDSMTLISSRARLCRELIEKVPTNDYGLPIGIYRPDLLPEPDLEDASIGGASEDPESSVGDGSSSEGETVIVGEVLPQEYSHPTITHGTDGIDILEDDIGTSPPTHVSDGKAKAGNLIPQRKSLASNLSHSAIKAAYVPLSYDEGYPTLPYGLPIWGQFPFESSKAYEVFQAYLLMPQADEMGVSARMLSELPRLAAEHGAAVKLSEVYEYFHLYYWGIRTKAYDMFQTAARKKQEELRTISVTNKHYDFADRLMRKLEEYMEDEEDFWDMMTPKTAVDMLKTVTALQRTSVGLPASGPAQHGKGDDPRGMSLEFIMRQVAQKTSVAKDHDTIDEQGNILNDILDDPEMTNVAQELILRLNKHG